MHQVLIVGHADADGHLIAEQVRRNLASIDSVQVSVVVDPDRTRDHRAWLNLDAIIEIADADYVFFVDLMFGPDSFAEEANALTEFVRARPEKRFFLIDHHPIPEFRLQSAPNLRAAYRSDVCECAIGPRSGMMVVAALCEHQSAEVADVKNPVHGALSIGMRRAAARGGPLPGEKLLALLKADQWGGLIRLGEDDPHYHRLHRGLRSHSERRSETLKELDEAATELLVRGSSLKKEDAMSYDAGIENEELSYRGGTRVLNKASSKDLGVIVTLLEVAALSLTPRPGATFTFDQLIGEARELGGETVVLDEKDVKTVLKKARFVKKAGKKYHLR
jgi:hypothetical protein